MIIDNLHFEGMTFPPGEADPPLVVDPNRVLSHAIPTQGLQMITWRRGQNLQLRGSVKLEEFAQRNSFEGPEPLALLVMEKVFRFLRTKTPDHLWSILRITLYVKRRLGDLTSTVSNLT